eukprot:9482922-Pyramimonas_sp.AAC.1
MGKGSSGRGGRGDPEAVVAAAAVVALLSPIPGLAPYHLRPSLSGVVARSIFIWMGSFGEVHVIV